MKSMRGLVIVWMVLFFLFAAASAFAQTYPSKPIQMIVGFPPGGATDIAARLVGQKLGDILGQPIIVDNRPGAGSNIGTELAAKASPDGHTLFVYTVANAINYSLFKELPFDMLKSFDPVTQLTSVTSFLVVHPSLPVNSVRDLIALAKSKPGELHFASSGIGGSPHLAGEMFKSVTGVNMVHIPYKGTAPELTELLAGHVKIAFETTPVILPHVKAGKLKALAVNSAQRSPLLPDLPTMAEAGLPGFEVTSWNGLVVPTGTPKEIAQRLNRETVKILQIPEVKEKLSSLGADPVGSTVEEFGKFIQAEIKKWAKVIKDAKVVLE